LVEFSLKACFTYENKISNSSTIKAKDGYSNKLAYTKVAGNTHMKILSWLVKQFFTFEALFDIFEGRSKFEVSIWQRV
jgi:hypothetical protein